MRFTKTFQCVKVHNPGHKYTKSVLIETKVKRGTDFQIDLSLPNGSSLPVKDAFYKVTLTQVEAKKK
jgi:hypothetical protein